MKKYSILIALAGLSMFISCKEVEDPDTADFSWYYRSDFEANILDLSKVENPNPSQIELKDEICFVAKGTEADSYVVWAGQPGSNYETRDLADSLLKDSANHVSSRSTGVALTSVKNGYHYKYFTFSSISPAEGFQMYCVARNYDYELDDYSEIKSKPYTINVVDKQLDLWPEGDPYNTAASSKYSMVFKLDGKALGSKQKITMSKDAQSVAANGYYEIDVENSKITITAKKGWTDFSNVLVQFVANNCIPHPATGTITRDEFGQWCWLVDLSTEQTLTIASQSAAEDAKSGDEFTKDYTFCVVKNPANE